MEKPHPSKQRQVKVYTSGYHGDPCRSLQEMTWLILMSIHGVEINPIRPYKSTNFYQDIS